MIFKRTEKNVCSMSWQIIYRFALILFFTLSSNTLLPQCHQNFNMNDFTWIGNKSRTNWVIVDINYVKETETGPPTFFISEDTLINVEITGQFKAGDADIMGFVFGYKNPLDDTIPQSDYYLFDWKPLSNRTIYLGGNFYTATKGFKLNKANGIISGAKHLWDHYNDTTFNTIATDPSNGYTIGVWYDFKLIYTTQRATILIDNDTIFDINGCFDAGRFGFYDYSMVNAEFKDFKYKYYADFVTNGGVLCKSNAVSFTSGITQDCSGNLISYNATPDSILWDFGDSIQTNSTNPSHTYASAGLKTIKMIVYGQNGCVDSISKSISIIQGPTAGFSNISLCEDDTITFHDTSLGNVVSWLWDLGNGQTAQTNNPLTTYNTPGSYNITMLVTDSNSCADSILKQITINENPSSNINGPIYYCGDSYQFDLNLPLGTDITWSDSTVGSTVTFTQSGMYSVTVKSNGCTGIDSFQLNLKSNPVAQFSSYDLCVGEPITLIDNSIGSIAQYSWDLGNGDSSTIMNPTVTYNTPGSYNIQLIVSSTDNCKDTTQGIISVTPYPVFDLGADTNTCEHQIDLNVGVSNAIYIWSNGTTDTNATFSQSGVVWVQVDSGNCTIRDSILLTFNEHPDADINIDGICINDSVIFYDVSTIGQSNIIQWHWTIGSQTFNTQIIDTQFTQEGNVTVSLVVTNDLGCTDSIDKNFYIHSPDSTQISTSGDVTIHVGDEAFIEAYGGQSHQWDPSHLTSNPNSDMTFVFPEQTTTFKVTALDDNGCVIMDSLTVEVYEETTIYIPTAFTPNGDGDNDYFYISGKNICDIEYKIYNRWGQMVFETNELNSKWDGILKDNTQNMEAFAISGKAELCDGDTKTFYGKVHLLR